MSTVETFRDLPKDCVIRILELFCESVIGDLTDWNGKDSYGALLHQYTQLLLVCRSFHSLTNLFVKVDGVPIRKKLIKEQKARFLDLLGTIEIRWPNDPRPATSSTWHGPDIQRNVLRLCGSAWNNSAVLENVPRLFKFENEHFEKMCLIWCYVAPKLFEKDLIDIKGILGGPTQWPTFASLRHKKKYVMEDSYNNQVEFVIGQYKFPWVYSVPGKYKLELDYDWVGMSILSFKDKFGKWFEGEEGRYWLWLAMPKLHGEFHLWRYQIMDYKRSEVWDCHNGVIARRFSIRCW